LKFAFSLRDISKTKERTRGREEWRSGDGMERGRTGIGG
jgi:hypothetical protein